MYHITRRMTVCANNQFNIQRLNDYKIKID